MVSNCKESPVVESMQPTLTTPKAPKKPYSENVALQRAHKLYYERHREELREQRRQYVINNRELINERMRVYLKKRRDAKKHDEEFFKKERAAALKVYYRKKAKKELERQAAHSGTQTSSAHCSTELK